ncbi:hypothetical protein FRC18_006569 [Serendipita sp. 400]|nr:hypothetical protein FRC18_006569 [Serendipita sp. 400]
MPSILLPLLFLFFMLNATTILGSALPERQDPSRAIAGRKNVDYLERRNWSTEPCASAEEPSVTAIGASLSSLSQWEPVIVTISVFVPASSPFTSLVTAPTLSSSTTSTRTRPTTTTSTPTSAPSTSTTTPSAASASDTPTAASAQEAQRLNVAFTSLSDTDACAAEQRACIDNMLAECVLSPSSSQPQWVTQACPVNSSNEGLTCAAVPLPPSTTTNSTSTSSSSTAPPSGVASPGTTYSLPNSIGLGCFSKSDISQRFASAGVQGGMFPPGLSNNGWKFGLEFGWWASSTTVIVSWILASTIM